MSEKFIVETSARHVHLTAEAFAVLFGEGKELTVKKMLSQPGQFASEERVTIVGPKKELPNVSILGPFRSANQVEPVCNRRTFDRHRCSDPRIR